MISGRLSILSAAIAAPVIVYLNVSAGFLTVNPELECSITLSPVIVFTQVIVSILSRNTISQSDTAVLNCALVPVIPTIEV